LFTNWNFLQFFHDGVVDYLTTVEQFDDGEINIRLGRRDDVFATSDTKQRSSVTVLYLLVTIYCRFCKL